MRSATQPRRIPRVLVATVVTAAGLAFGPGLARAAGTAVTISASASTVSVGGQVVMTATTPIVDPGTVTQSITQVIDTTKSKLTSAADITFPAGWTLTYSTDGTTFSATAPATSNAWAAVRAVKATGPVVSQGSSNGKQVAVGSATQPTVPPVGGFSAAMSGGDPYHVSFDDDGRVFTYSHHKNPSLFVCYNRDGTVCTGWSGGFVARQSGYDAYSWVDTVNNRLWYPTWDSSARTWRGFACIDVTPGATPVNCSVTGLSSGYLSFGGGFTAPSVAGGYGSIIQGAVPYGGNLYGWDHTTGAVVCANISTVPLGPCTGGSWSSGASTVADFSSSYANVNGAQYWGVNIQEFGGKLWVFAKTNGGTTPRLACIEPTSGAYCAGWSTSVGAVTGSPNNASTYGTGPVALPNASGTVVAVCGFGTAWSCWSVAGSAYTPPSNFSSNVYMRKSPVLQQPQTFGSKIYSDYPYLNCFDAATNAVCSGFPLAYGAINSNDYYSIADDPLNPGCIWYANDFGRLGTFNGSTGGTCSQSPTKINFGVSTVIPRLGCSNSSAIGQWGTFTLTSPASNTYTNGLVAVLNSGNTVATFPLTNGAADLSTLDVGVSGQSPVFQVSMPNAIGSPSNGSATLTAIGEAPQLCLNLTALAQCPAGTGPVPTLQAGSFSTTGSGTYTNASNVTTSLASSSVAVGVAAASASQCGSTLSGTSTVSGGSTPVAGATVTLLDASGNPVLDSNGQAVTTTTASDGTYSFGYVLPGTYKVRFSDTSTATADATAVVSGGSGTTQKTTCPGGGTTASIQTGMNAVTGASVLDRTSPSNLVQNGDFTSTAAGYPAAGLNFFYTHGTMGASKTVSSKTATVVAIPNWTATGGSDLTYAFWANTTGSSMPVATVMTNTSGGNDIKHVYFGNNSGASITPSATFSTQGFSTTNYTITPMSGYGTASTPPAITQSGIPTVAGRTYRLQFLQGYENWGSVSGIAAIDITGYPTTYFEVKFAVRRVTLEFVATSSSTSLTFKSWGHIPSATELVLDDVIINQCTTLTNIDSATTTLYVGQNGVVNGSYIVAATASADTSTGGQGVAQTINILANDSASTGANITSPTINFCTTTSPATGCTLTTKTVSGQGIYTISGGSVVFTPCSAANTPAGAGCTAAFTGTATPVAYQITDSAGSTATATVTPTVVAVPTASADTSTGNYYTAQTKNIFTNDSAATGATIAASSIRLCNPTTTPAQTPNNCTVAAGTTITVASVGTYAVDSNGVITFTPLASFSGTPPALAYQIQDSLGQYASSTYTPTVLPPPPPTANPDTTTGVTGTAQSKNVLTNDVVGASGVTFTTSTIKLCSSGQTSPNCTATSVVVPGQGTYTVNTSTGVVTFTPCTGANTPAGVSCTGAFSGTATPATYQITTNTSQTVSSTYTPTFVAPPTGVADTGTGNWDINQTFTPTANDTAGTGTTLNPVPLGICTNPTAVASCTGTSLTVANQGTYTLNTTTGVVTFDPLPAFTGTATPIEYVVQDALGQKTASTITPTVTPPPAPAATPQQKVVLPGGSVAFTTLTGTGGLATTGGPAFTTSATCLVNSSVVPNTCGTTLTVTGEGSYSLNTSTGVVTFTASGGATSGVKTPITYRVTDATGQTATSTLTPVIPAPPVLADDTSVNEQNATQVINLLANDSATAYTTLSPTSVKLCPAAATAPYTATNCNLTTRTISNEGIYTVNPDGTVSFVPCTSAGAGACPSNTKYNGVATTIRYIAADNLGQVANATFTATVLPPPVAQASNDSGTAAFAQPVVINPLANDSGGTTTGLVGYTSTGTATLDPTTVRLCSAGQSAPNCTATSLTTADGTYAVNTATGVVTFNPATNFTGTPTNAPGYQVCNTIGGNWQPMAPPASCATARITPTIQPPGVPFAANDYSTGAYNTTQAISVLSNDTKDPSLTLLPSTVRLCGATQSAPNCSLTSLTVAGEGTYVVNTTTGVVTFTPLSTFTGTVASPPTYQVTDSFGATVSAVITPTVTPPPAPSATPESRNVVPGGTATYTNVIGSSALANGTGLQSGNLAGPCIVDPSDSTCKATFTITGEGTWTVDRLTGTATFVADNAASSGTKTPVTYRVTDVVGQTATSTLTPVIPPVPVPTNDTSIDSLDVNQVINIIGNDVAGTGTTLVASSIRLCGPGQTAPNCTLTSLTVAGEGTYTVNNDGTVTFDPDPDFAGTATPVDYQVSDSFGRVVSARITPTVTSVPPTALPDTVTVTAGQSAAFRPVFGTNGLAAPANGGPALTTNTVCIVDPATNTCGTSVTVPGEGTYSLNVVTGVVTYSALSTTTAGVKTPVTYRITDVVGFTVSSTLTPTVRAATNGGVNTNGATNPGTTTTTTTTTTTVPTKSTVSTGKPRVVDQRNWTKPGVPTYLNPTRAGHASPGEAFVTGKTRVWDARNRSWSTYVVTDQGTWTVIRNNVRFTPADGFTGEATIPFTATDSAGRTSRAVLTVLVTEKSPQLPATGTDSSRILVWAALMIVTGILVRRRRPAPRRG